MSNSLSIYSPQSMYSSYCHDIMMIFLDWHVRAVFNKFEKKIQSLSVYDLVDRPVSLGWRYLFAASTRRSYIVHHLSVSCPFSLHTQSVSYIYLTIVIILPSYLTLLLSYPIILSYYLTLFRIALRKIISIFLLCTPSVITVQCSLSLDNNYHNIILE